MSGRDTTRGILLQAIVCLLGALENDSEWKSLTLEPDFKSEKVDSGKVDIAWYYSDSSEIKVTQVKSSRRQLTVRDAKKWAKELEASLVEATSYELLLIGPCSEQLSKGQKFGRVEVPCPKPLDIQGLIEQSAHRLAIYLEGKELSAGKAPEREGVVRILVEMLQEGSIESRAVSRDNFGRLLDKWVKDAFAKQRTVSPEQLLKLKEKIEKLLEELLPIQELHIDHSDAMRWRLAVERYMRDLDKVLPGYDFEKKRANIAWHKGNTPATEKDYRRGCDMTRGLLESALQAIHEQLDEVRGNVPKNVLRRN